MKLNNQWYIMEGHLLVSTSIKKLKWGGTRRAIKAIIANPKRLK